MKTQFLWPSPLVVVMSAALFAGEPAAVPQPPALPTKPQVLWADLEHGQFMHCNHPGDIATMNYPNFDAGKFAECALAQNARYVVFVAKHVDGFCWWQTQTSDYSIKSAPWKAGRGDVFGEVVAACRVRGLKVGFYLSPADDRFGAGVSGIAVDPTRQNAFNDYYCTQLRELCTHYGPMVEIWFDGALFPSLRKRVEEIIVKHQPDACTFQGPVNTIRWIGNEAGAAPNPAWNAINRESYLAMTSGKGYPTCGAGDPRGVFWAPNEADTTLSTDWFGGEVRPLNTLVQCYYNSVGNGAQLLMNVSPRPDGSISPDNVKRAKELGDAIRSAVGYSLCSTSGTGKSLILKLETPLEYDHVILQEEIGRGERVRKYALEMLAGKKWEPIGQGTSIGHKKIHSFSPRVASQIRLTVLVCEGVPQIRTFCVTRTGQAFRDRTPPSVPKHVEATAINDRQIDLTWSAAQDPETGIARYRVLRNGAPAGESTVARFSDREVFGSTRYTYQIVAVNGAGME